MIAIIGIACQPRKTEITEHIKGWEQVSTIQVLPNKSVFIKEKRANIIKGENNVVMVRFERRPIYKSNKDTLMDVYASRNLLIELNWDDSLITPNHLGKSKIYREILAMSPKYGVNNLEKDEKITIQRIGHRWEIISALEDFKFHTQFSFTDSSLISSRQEIECL